MSVKRSNPTVEPLVFDVPTTADDVAALRRARATGVPSFAEHIRRLSRGPHADSETLARRPLPIGFDPFHWSSQSDSDVGAGLAPARPGRAQGNPFDSQHGRRLGEGQLGLR